MADLSVEVVRRYGRQLIMPPFSVLSPFQGVLIDNVKIGETLTRAITLLRLVQQEDIKLSANTVSHILGNTGEVAFNASPDQAVITNYTARVRVSGSSTVVATQDLGVPTPDGNGVIIVNMAATFAGLATGNYTVSILATSAGGSTDSTESAPFALPLS